MRWMAFALMASVVVGSGCEKKPASIALEPTTILPMERKGKTQQMKAQLKDDKDIFIAVAKPVWESSDVSVATVSTDGLITAVGTGKADIKATQDGVSASVPVEVKIVGSVEIEPKTPQKLRMGRSMNVKVIVKDDRGNVLENEKVRFKTVGYAIDVEPDGKVTGQAVGDSDLVAMAQDKQVRLQFTVTD